MTARWLNGRCSSACLSSPPPKPPNSCVSIVLSAWCGAHGWPELGCDGRPRQSRHTRSSSRRQRSPRVPPHLPFYCVPGAPTPRVMRSVRSRTARSLRLSFVRVPGHVASGLSKVSRRDLCVAHIASCALTLVRDPPDRALSAATGASMTPLTSTSRCGMASHITPDPTDVQDGRMDP